VKTVHICPFPSYSIQIPIAFVGPARNLEEASQCGSVSGTLQKTLTPNRKNFVTVFIWYFYTRWHVFLLFKIKSRFGRWFQIGKSIGSEDPHQSLFGSGTLVLTGLFCRRRVVHSCRVPARVHKVSHVAPPGHGRGHGVRGRGLLPQLRNQLVLKHVFMIIWNPVILI